MNLKLVLTLALLYTLSFGGGSPTKDYGDAPDGGSYKYNKSKYDTNVPARRNAERVTPNVYLGSAVNAEDPGHFSANADGDSDDAITNPADLIVDKDAGTYSIDIYVKNKGSGTYDPPNGTSQDLDKWRYISAWIDWDNNGIYDNDEMINAGGDKGYIGISKQYEGTKTLTWDVPSGLSSGDKRFMRIRLTQCAIGNHSDSEVVSYRDCSNATNGYASFGEIEDYLVSVGGSAPVDANAMILTRDGTNQDKTRVYTFNLDTTTDEITNFTYKATLTGRFRSLVYHDGKFITAKAWGTDKGKLYSIALDGTLTREPSYGDLDGTLNLGNVESLAFDESGNRLFTQSWHADGHISKNTAGNYIYDNSSPNVNYALAYHGDSKYTVSFESNGVKNLDLSGSSTLTDVTGDSGISCTYGGESVGNGKSYFVVSKGAESDKNIYVVNGTTWSSISFNYGAYTNNSKAEAIAIVHTLPPAPVCEEGSNLVKNPSFEDSPYNKYWTGDIWKGTSYNIPDGSQYGYVDKDHGGVGYQDIHIEKGKKYKLTFDAAIGGVFNGQHVSIEYLSPTYNPKNIKSGTDITNKIQPSHNFQTYTLSLPEAIEDATYIRIKFDTKSGDFLKVDNFDLRVDCEEQQRGFSISDAQLGEEEAAAGEQMRFQVATNLVAPAGGIDIKYKIKNATAFAGSDFTANLSTTYTAHIKEGERTVDIFVPIIDDNELEDAEYFEVELEPYTGATIPKPIAIGVIIDNDMEAIPPTQGGSYTINDYGLSGDILRTKIAGETTKITIKAISGFSILHDRERHTGRNCTTSCTCGPCNKQVCSTTCSTYVYYVDVNSNKMNIDEVILHYQDGTTRQLLGAYEISSGDTLDLTLPTDKATKVAWITVKGHSDTLYGTGDSIELNVTSDAFAIRPDRFEIDLEGYNNTDNPLIAQKDITFKIEAVTTAGVGHPVSEYSGSNFTQTVIDAKYGDSISHGLDISGQSFSSGILSKTHMEYTEVGDLTITIEEKAPFFAEVDATDNPTTYKITPATYSVKIIPHKFDISYSVADANDIDKITFFANNLTMSSAISYSVTAKGEDNIITTRYDGSTGYSYNQDVKVTHAIESDTDTLNSSLTINYKDSKVNTTKSFTGSAGTTLNLTLNNTDFTDGVATDTINENFHRDNKIAKNPLKLNTTKIEVKESNGIAGHLVEGTKELTKSVNFYYGRAHAPSPQTTAGTSLDAKIYYEIYCNSCDILKFTHADNRASIDSVRWYILPPAVYNNFATSVCDYISPRAIDTTATATYNDEATINVTAPNAPHANKIFYTPSSTFLQYHRFGTGLPEHFFNVKFSNANSVWAGEGNQGMTVDTNISKIYNQSTEW